jgi:serpin B
MNLLRSLLLSVCAATHLLGADINSAASAINELGLDLHRKLAKGDVNLCLSPYSIQSALAMTFAGADGNTRTEMAKVLHFPNDDAELHASFAALKRSLDTALAMSEERAKQSQEWGGPREPITLLVANRLFGQKGFEFRAPFLELVKDRYGAPLEQLDFVKGAAQATAHINGWVEDQTRKRIRELIPEGMLGAQTRLVLANAVYLKAPWAEEFYADATKSEPFHVHGGTTSDVPMMLRHDKLGYARHDGFTALTIPYIGGDLHFLVLVPDDVNGLTALEAKLSAATLAECVKLNPRDVILHLPKFKLEPPTMSLTKELQGLGMKTAFDQPIGSANFDRLAPRRGNDYLFISEVFHKTFIAVDEKGTEAAAATAVAMDLGTAIEEPSKPVEVKVDRPFVFAIQHGPSGACLFLGRVTDPR